LHDGKQAAEAILVVIKAATLGVRVVIAVKPAIAKASPVILSKEVCSDFRAT
jgi:hypothetical protein